MPATDTQLSLIRELAGLLGRAGIRFWLRGGWALDFHAGRITRAHRDIDLVTWARHRRRLVRLLEAAGYATRRSETAQIFVEKLGHEVNFVFLYRRGGEVVTPGFEHWPWPEGAFSQRRLELEGVLCRALSLEALLEEKEHYDAYLGTPLRPKDEVSLRALRALVPPRASSPRS
jgi:hypothetical protein